MHSTFAVTELMVIFRDGLLALISIAKRAQIAWAGSRVYDPWEEMEVALFQLIVGSVATNAVEAPFASMPRYGLVYKSYADFGFLTDRSARLHGRNLVFCDLTTLMKPFDTAQFFEADGAFVPSASLVQLPFSAVKFEFGARTKTSVRYFDVIDYN